MMITSVPKGERERQEEAANNGRDNDSAQQVSFEDGKAATRHRTRHWQPLEAGRGKETDQIPPAPLEGRPPCRPRDSGPGSPILDT